MCKSALYALVLLFLPSAALATGAEFGYCQSIGLTSSALDYRECRALLHQSQSGDQFQALMAKGRLIYLQQHHFNVRRAEQEQPDFSAYGEPAAPLGSRPGDCMMYGDGEGGGVMRCR